MKIAFLGDIAFHGKFCIESNNNLYEYFDDARKFLSNCDYVVGNLETPFVIKAEKSGCKSAYISSLTKNVELLKFLNVNAVNLSNNHIFDFGLEGFEDTVNTLKDNDIEWFGASSKDLLISSQEKIAFHGYCSYNTNPIGIKSKFNPSGITPLKIDSLYENARSYQSKGYLNVISVHSGIEHVTIPSLDDLNFARKLSKKIPYIYYGHHPHVMQGIETMGNSLIAYSLGNFCFDDVYDVYDDKKDKPIVTQSEENKASIILIVDVVDGKIVDYKSVGIYQSDTKLVVNSLESEKKCAIYSKYLNLKNDDFSRERKKQILAINSSRNSDRDIAWLINRFNFDTITRVLERFYNRYNYKKHFSSKIDFL